jgi:hypothetical protein
LTSLVRIHGKKRKDFRQQNSADAFSRLHDDSVGDLGFNFEGSLRSILR